MTRGYVSSGVNGCQGVPWNENLDVKKLHGAAWWRLRSRAEKIRCFMHIVDLESNDLPSIYKCGIMLIFRGCVWIDPL